jgi:hypothetical protein
MNLWTRCTRYLLLWTPSQLDDFFDLITKIIENIQRSPEERKYKELKLSNSMIQKRIVERAGGLDFMQAIGFVALTIGENKMLCFSDEYFDELLPSLNWLRRVRALPFLLSPLSQDLNRETIETCKKTLNGREDEQCCTCVIQVKQDSPSLTSSLPSDPISQWDKCLGRILSFGDIRRGDQLRSLFFRSGEVRPSSPLTPGLPPSHLHPSPSLAHSQTRFCFASFSAPCFHFHCLRSDTHS